MHKRFLFIFIIIVLVIGGAFFGRHYFQNRDAQVNESNSNSVIENSNLNDSGNSISRFFNLEPNQTIQAPELDVQLVVLNYVFVPCDEVGATCKYRFFHVEIAASLISDPTRSERVTFENFPNQSAALGKQFQIADADRESFRMLVVGQVKE